MYKLIAFSILITLFSCTKPSDDDQDPVPVEQKQYTYRAKSITFRDYRTMLSRWTYDAQGRANKLYIHQAEFTFFYNPDGTIKNFVGHNTSDQRMAGGIFRYSGGKLVRVLMTHETIGAPVNSAWFADSASSFNGYYFSVAYNADNTIKNIEFNDLYATKPYYGIEYFYKVGNDSTHRVQRYSFQNGTKILNHKLEFVSNKISNPLQEIPFLGYTTGGLVPGFVVSYPWHSNADVFDNYLAPFPHAVSSFKAYNYNYDGSLYSADSARFRYRYATDSTAIYIKEEGYNGDSTIFEYDKLPK